MTSSFYENPMFPHVRGGGHACGGGFWQRTCYGDNLPKLANFNKPPSNETTFSLQVANINTSCRRGALFCHGSQIYEEAVNFQYVCFVFTGLRADMD